MNKYEWELVRRRPEIRVRSKNGVHGARTSGLNKTENSTWLGCRSVTALGMGNGAGLP